MTNCFITGYDKDEVYGTPLEPTDSLKPVFNFKFTNCVLTTVQNEKYQNFFVNCTYTEAEAENKSNFRTIDTDKYFYDFRLSESSVARGKGANIDDLLDYYPADRMGIQRKPESIDVGCYQFQ